MFTTLDYGPVLIPGPASNQINAWLWNLADEARFINPVESG